MLVVAAAALVLGAWSAWLVHRARLATWLYAPVAVATIGELALVWLSIAQLTKELADASELNPADRQAALSDGISTAMLPAAVALLASAVWLVALTIATWSLHRRGRLTPRSPTAP